MVCDKRDFVTKEPGYTWYDDKQIADNIPGNLIPKTKLQEIQEEKAKRKYNKRFKRRVSNGNR